MSADVMVLVEVLHEPRAGDPVGVRRVTIDRVSRGLELRVEQRAQRERAMVVEVRRGAEDAELRRDREVGRLATEATERVGRVTRRIEDRVTGTGVGDSVNPILGALTRLDPQGVDRFK